MSNHPNLAFYLQYVTLQGLPAPYQDLQYLCTTDKYQMSEQNIGLQK